MRYPDNVRAVRETPQRGRSDVAPQRIAIACALIVIAILMAPIAAAQTQPDAFAYGMRIDTVGLQPVQSVMLTQGVYENLTRSDLGDLRVFNAAGQPVPHALHLTPEQQASTSDVSALPFFPVYGQQGESMGDLGVQVRRTNEGTLVRIDGQNRRQTPALRAYIVDASQLETPVNELAFVWETAPQDLLVPVTVETSNDLLNWQRWGTPGTLASVSHAGQILTQNSLDLPTRKAQYYRISWPASAAFPPLDRIDAITAVNSREVDRLWMSIALQKTDNNTYTAELKGAIPAERIQIEFPDSQSFVRVRLASANKPDGPWQTHHEGLAYRMQAGDASWTAPPVSIYRNENRFWQLTILQEEDNTILGTPSLRFGWTPARVLFVPQGEAPFTLAFGNAAAEPAAFSSSELIRPVISDYKSVFDLEMATLDAASTLGGEARLEPSTELPWQQIVLWGSLLLGVLVLGGLAMRLLKQS